MRVPPVENPAFPDFEIYGEVPETAPLDFTEDDVTWVASKLSGTAGALGAEAIELRNWLLPLACSSEELRVVFARLADWMSNSPPPRAAYHALMVYPLVALDKKPGVRPVRIGETLCRALYKLVMRAAGDPTKMACGNLHLSAGLEADIEGATHAVGQRRLERVRVRRRVAEEQGTEEGEAENGEVACLLNNLTIGTGETDGEESEGLKSALEMEVVGDGKDDGAGKGEEEGAGNLQALGVLEFLTQNAEPSGTTLGYAF